MLLVLQECRVAGAYGRGPRHFHVPHGRDYFDAGNCRTCECRNGNATALCRYHMTHAHAHATALCRYHMTHAHAHATALCRYHMTHAHAHATALCRYHMTHAHAHATALCRYHMTHAHAHATCAHNLCTCMHMCTNNSSGLPPPFPLTSPPSPPPSSTPSLPPPLPPSLLPSLLPSPSSLSPLLPTAPQGTVLLWLLKHRKTAHTQYQMMMGRRRECLHMERQECWGVRCVLAGMADYVAPRRNVDVVYACVCI